MTGFSYIGSIWMRGNEITVINKRTFEGTEQAVRRLDLGANQLTSVDFSMFDTFTQLQVKLSLLPNYQSFFRIYQ